MFRTKVIRLLLLVVIGCVGLRWLSATDGRQPSSRLEIKLVREPVERISQYSRFEIEAQLNRRFRNPFDPQEIDYSIEFKTPNGSVHTHPGFYSEPYELVLDHNQEVPRTNGNPGWHVRFTPTKSGEYSWKLIAQTPDETAELAGTFRCEKNPSKGFVRVSRIDNTYFEFSNGDFFFPLGHTCRSPIDDRWARDAELHDETRIAERGVFCFDDWFSKMRRNGENFTSVWMAPWWCGLEWSRELPGYDGLGRYNQVNAARLDRVIEAAEKNNIYLILFCQNHGKLASCIDGEWHDNPLNERFPGGFLEFATDFFSSEKAKLLQQNQLRYTIARWGYSTSIAAWSISSETDWIEAYHGIRKVPKSEGAEEKTYEIDSRKEVVADWLIDTSRFISKTDAHPHIVSSQFSVANQGNEMWNHDEMQIVLNNAYTTTVTRREWQEEHFAGSYGVADAIFLFGKRYGGFDDRPRLVAEWGGSALENVIPHLQAELHTGIWASFMSDLSGVTGYWWWNEVDADDLYFHYAALSNFSKGEDRRGRKLISSRAKVVTRFPARSETGHTTSLFVESPQEQALVLSDKDSAYGYIFDREINQSDCSRPASGFHDRTFENKPFNYLELPPSMLPGTYEVEFWDTFDGKVIHRKDLVLAPNEPRLLQLIEHRVDLALKIKRKKAATPN